MALNHCFFAAGKLVLSFLLTPSTTTQGARRFAVVASVQLDREKTRVVLREYIVIRRKVSLRLEHIICDASEDRVVTDFV